MQIEIKIDPACAEPKIVVLTDKLTEEVTALVQKLSESAPQILAGFRDDTLTLLEERDVIRVFASAGKVVAATADGEYVLRRRLYELEESLDPSRFVRISNSEIVNLTKVKGFDLSFVGTIRVTLSDGAVTRASRRYVAKIKQVLGISRRDPSAYGSRKEG